jgi:hypothetical protein
MKLRINPVLPYASGTVGKKKVTREWTEVTAKAGRKALEATRRGLPLYEELVEDTEND